MRTSHGRLEALRKAGYDVFSIAESCPGVSDDEVIAVCADQERVLLTFDKDSGELVFRRGLSAATGVVLFRITPESPDDAVVVALALVDSQPELAGCTGCTRSDLDKNAMLRMALTHCLEILGEAAGGTGGFACQAPDRRNRLSHQGSGSRRGRPSMFFDGPPLLTVKLPGRVIARTSRSITSNPGSHLFT